MADTAADAPHVLVTGAASGIGRAAALRFARDGARLTLLDLNTVGLQAVVVEAAGLGGAAIAVTADVSVEDDVAGAVARGVAEHGPLSVAVPNAGVELTGQDAAVHELSLEVWQRTIGINLTGCFLTCKHAIASMLTSDGGAVVVTGSPDGMYGIAIGAHAYSASKGGVHGLVRIMAAEYATAGIRVNAVVPGWIDTPINRALLESEQGIDDDIAKIPMKRMGSPEEVAELIAFLASDKATYSTGGFYAVDGGLTAV